MSRFAFEELQGKEWLEANGLGGWASVSLSGALTRRYHGLLVGALSPPGGRMVLLSKLDETLLSGGQRFELGCNSYPGAIHPRGFEFLEAYTRDLFPVLDYRMGGMLLRKTVAAIHGENSTLIQYELSGSEGPVSLELRPLCNPRPYHNLKRENASLRWDCAFEQGVLALSPYEGVPPVLISAPGSHFAKEQAWYRNFQYAREQERGLDFEEDLFCHGVLTVALRPGQPFFVLVSTQDPRGRDGAALLTAERQRREGLLKGKAAQDPLTRRLLLAAEQFLVKRGQGLSTVIAGYPWFMDWGRDSMIALRGLCLSSGRLAEARGILEAFLQCLSRGMLPNRFPDEGEAAPPEYNTADATLWLFVAVYDFFRLGGDRDFTLKRCLPALLDILAWHRRGTRYGIRVDADGLLRAGEAGVQLTWMDAKVGDLVVTPRQGKAVELNALWFNALRISAALSQASGEAAEAAELEAEAGRCKASFESGFWNAGEGCCYDVIGQGQPDASLRPNQIFALSLPFPLFTGEKAERILRVIGEKLLTPRGLRSLSPDDPRYVGRYEGGVAQRDGAYHQGTAWAWLLGPYMEALLRLRGAEGKAQARALMAQFAPHLDEAGLGTVSEIFDGDAPHAPKGCIAQAWNVSELLRIQLEFLS